MVTDLGVETPADLYRLTKEDLLKLDGVKDKKADKIIAAIDASRKVTTGKFIMALGIPGVGKKTASDLAKDFGTLDAFLAADKERLISVDGLGDIIAENVTEYIATHGAYIKRLRSILTIQEERTGVLSGKKFVLTGSLPTLTRSKVAALIESAGGAVLSSVTKETDYVVAGEDAGAKLDKAKKLSKTVIGEKELLQLLQKDGEHDIL